MTARSIAATTGSALHALIVGAAVALFVFILCWAGEASGFYPPRRAPHRTLQRRC